MHGAVHELSCVVGFTVRLGQLGLTRSRSGVCVCVFGAACRAFWPDLGRAIECSVARGQRLGVGWWGVSLLAFGVRHLCL